jgi:hypothetical protein
VPVYDLVDADGTPLVDGAGGPDLVEGSATVIPRFLYLYENVAVEALTVQSRELYAVENRGVEALAVAERPLYLYENLGIEVLSVLMRAVYGYEALANGELFPWLWKLRPVAQYRLGQVDVWGDGLGDTPSAEGSSLLLHAEACGIVSWQSRSAGLWPGDGVASDDITEAVIFTVPADGESGAVVVEETT